jgi:membrane-associated protease RseP (regulator of RpoE activity)
LGSKLIDKVGEKNPKIMKFLSYVSILIGYLLMIFGVYFFLKVIWIYISRADIVSAVKVPPIMPLIPYLPQMFKLSWLPDFYFTYWIVILAIIAITHEFAHGIFAAYHKIKIKTTGFGFFPYFSSSILAAFVELDEEKMQKEGNFKQLSILAAGTFANILTAVIAFVLMAGFFVLAYAPTGVVFDNYAYNQINWSDTNITQVNGQNIEMYEMNLSSNELINLSTSKGEYILNPKTFANSSTQIGEDIISILYYNAPAINANLTGAISKINGEEIDSLNKLSEELNKYQAGDSIEVTTILSNLSENNYNLTLQKNPLNESRNWIGIVFSNSQTTSKIGSLVEKANSYKNPNVIYVSRIGELGDFIYNLLWWLFLISISVALVICFQ